jgi:hypothetical protein
MQSSKMDYEGIMNFIIENELTDSVVLVLHPQNFDSVAMDYISKTGTIERPFEILGIEIVEDTTGKVQRNKLLILEQ